jgi:hypothetical protein
MQGQQRPEADPLNLPILSKTFAEEATLVSNRNILASDGIQSRAAAATQIHACMDQQADEMGRIRDPLDSGKKNTEG